MFLQHLCSTNLKSNLSHIFVRENLIFSVSEVYLFSIITHSKNTYLVMAASVSYTKNVADAAVDLDIYFAI